MRGKPSNDDDSIVGKKYRARAAAQQIARKKIREAHKEEYDRYYHDALVEVFKERGLGDPYS